MFIDKRKMDAKFGDMYIIVYAVAVSFPRGKIHKQDVY